MSIDPALIPQNTTQSFLSCEGSKKENKLPLDVREHIAPKQSKTVRFNEEIFYRAIETAKEIENPRELWYSQEEEAEFLADSIREQNAASTSYEINQENIPPQMSADEILAQRVGQLRQLARESGISDEELFNQLVSVLNKRV